MSHASDSLRQSRRQFVQGVGVVGSGLLAGCERLPWQIQAQQTARSYRIGWLHFSSPLPSGSSPEYEALQEGLRELGYLEGHNLVMDARYAEGQAERLPALAAELVSLQPDVIVVISTQAARATQTATSTIPIVFSGLGDPVGSGFVASYAHPGGNLTGLTTIA